LVEGKPELFIEVHSRILARECYEILSFNRYEVVVLETSRVPDFGSEPEVCHFRARPVTS